MSNFIRSIIPISLTPVFQGVRNPLTDYSLSFPKDSRFTKQSFKDECDINTIMSRYMSTGEMPVINEVAPQYLDVDSSFDFQSMQNKVIEAQELFDALPSKLRTRFGNQPSAFLEYVADPRNRSEMAELGLLSREVAEQVLKAVPDPSTYVPEASPKV